MQMPVRMPVTTIEQLLALPDDGMRHELLDAEHVVTPAPSPDHERVVLELYVRLREAVGDNPRLEVFGGKADIRLNPRTLVQPDVFIIEVPSNGPIRAWADAPVPMLAIEVLSPSTAARDRGTKRKLYLAAGVEEYWIVDIDARLVERWRQGDTRPEIVDGKLAWRLSIGASGEILIPDLFHGTGP